MNSQELFQRYIELCTKSFAQNSRIQTMVRKRGLTDAQILGSFYLGYADGSAGELIDNQEGIHERLERIGLLERGKERLKGFLTIPVRDTAGGIVNIVGYSPWPNAKQREVALNEAGIFNAQHLQHTEEIVLAEDPISALLLIQHGITGTTFAFGDDGKYVKFFRGTEFYLMRSRAA